MWPDWQTESGWPILCNPKGQQLLPTKPGSATFPSCGYNLAVLSDTGEPLTTPNTEGNLALRLPLPPGCLLGLWGNKQRYVSSYLTRFPATTTRVIAGTWTSRAMCTS